ncbi:DUF5995 family protein [Roseiflexus sp.]|uniref:DUF5995 family protein n=1 Tax=Roseiflexus sp. TaxID=2562120 RepID=UPI0021DD5C21|nr:DUF5995 family protein [Roseiflexus sp.]GIV99568.1 MAG: hypothetical protein KatS3mg058_0972 [Roseiflexus sp.]
MIHHELLERMHSRVDAWDATGDRRAIFLACYALMTRNMLEGVEAGRFDDNAWVHTLVHQFAEYYFIALEGYDCGAGWLPEVWRQAHNLTRTPNVPPLVHLLLGINAHINCDLTLVLDDLLRGVWDDLTPLLRESRRNDYLMVNTIIGETIDVVQDTVLERYSPAMNIIDVAFGSLDEWVTARLIRNWRRDVWDRAMVLVQTHDTQMREALRHQADLQALQRMRLVVTGGALGARSFGFSQRWLRRLGLMADTKDD